MNAALTFAARLTLLRVTLLEMKRAVSAQVMAPLPATMLYVEDYAEDAMDIRNTLVTTMQELSPEEFEQLLLVESLSH